MGTEKATGASVANQRCPNALLDLGHDCAIQTPGTQKVHAARAVDENGRMVGWI